MDFAAVASAIRNAHELTVAPYFGALQSNEVEEKSPGELVTIADRACEEELGQLLHDIVDAPVIGEEAAAVDPTIVDKISTAPSVWLVDPIDGTSNFAAGRPEYAVMVAYVEHGTTTASWIFQPEFDRLAIAARGAGATVNDVAVEAPAPSADPMNWHGVVKGRFLPPGIKATVAGTTALLGEGHEGENCAGFEYPALLGGDHSFLFYWRTLPWDHAPGVLLAEESGCHALRPSGRAYSLTDEGQGLLVAHRSIAESVLRTLLDIPDP